MFDSFFSGDGFISIFFLLFIVAFVAILGMILVTFVRELSQRNRNNHSPPADGGGHSGGQAPELLLPPQRR